MVAISVIVPTCGRHTLCRALESVVPQLAGQDEVLVVGDGRQPSARQLVAKFGEERLKYFEFGPTGFLGNAQRNFAASKAHGDLLVFLDDDDYLAESAFDDIRGAWEQTPGRPLMFKIKFHEPPLLKWREPIFADENISGGSFVVPNVPDRLSRWPEPSELGNQFADRTFIEETLRLWPPNSLVWREELIYHVPKANHNAP